MSIFKAYDIRGIYPGEINEEIAYRIGRALVTFIKCNEVCVCRDARLSSPKLFSALVKGVTEQGADVIDIGLCSTPLFYFATREYEGGIMVTASHNPAKYNGFKICRNGTIPVGGESGLKEIEKLIQENKFQDSEIKGSVFKKDYLKDFVEFCMAHQGSIKKLKIVVDTGNGMGGYFFPKVFENLHQISLIPLFWKVDMTFPNHEADPLKPENMKDLQEAVKKHKAELGIALDGDADRIMFVDEMGEIVPAYFITALIGLEMLKEKPKSSMGYDIRSSKIVREVWEKAGAKVTITRIGHSLIKETMRKEHLLFVGEVSGHYFYEDTDYAENTAITALKVLNIMSEQNKPLSEIIKPLKKYSQSGEINFEAADKEAKMKQLEEIYKGKAKNINWLDGITVEFKDWWFNVRPSNTEPLLRLNLEANTKELMEEKVKEISGIIKG